MTSSQPLLRYCYYSFYYNRCHYRFSHCYHQHDPTNCSHFPHDPCWKCISITSHCSTVMDSVPRFSTTPAGVALSRLPQDIDGNLTTIRLLFVTNTSQVPIKRLFPRGAYSMIPTHQDSLLDALFFFSFYHTGPAGSPHSQVRLRQVIHPGREKVAESRTFLGLRGDASEPHSSDGPPAPRAGGRRGAPGQALTRPPPLLVPRSLPLAPSDSLPVWVCVWMIFHPLLHSCTLWFYKRII